MLHPAMEASVFSDNEDPGLASLYEQSIDDEHLHRWFESRLMAQCQNTFPRAGMLVL